MLVAKVGGALEAPAIARDLLAVEPGLGLPLEVSPHGLERRHVVAAGGGPARRGSDGAHERRADVGVEQPPGGEHARVGRDHDAGDVEQLRQPAGVQRPRAAEGHEREAARVVAATHGDRADAARHRVVDDLDDAGGGLVHREAERAGHPRLDGRARGADVEGKLAAEQRRRDAARARGGHR